MSDSEYDTEVLPEPVTKKPKAAKSAAKRTKVAPVTNAAALARPPLAVPTTSSDEGQYQCARKRKSGDIFGLLRSEDQASTSTAPSRAITTSSFTTRVSGGQSRRTVSITEGDFFVEVKLYNLTDVQNTAPEERYKKALSSIKLRLNENCKQWDALQEFLMTTFKLFKNANPTKFSDRINFK